MLDAPTHAVFALLAAGHLLADFVFQSGELVRAKLVSRGALRRHAALVTLVQALVVLPFYPDLVGLACVLVIGVTHYFIDMAKIALDRRAPRPLTWFLLDQGAHLVVLLLAAIVWGVVAGSPSFGGVRGVTAVAWLVGGLAFNVNGGSALVSATLAQLRATPRSERARDDDPGAAGAGRLIGILERLLILFAVLAGEWSAVGLVLAAKSIARFKELEDRDFAELYLVGTLASVLVAVVSATLLAQLMPADNPVAAFLSRS